jgi:hypothetical protein
MSLRVVMALDYDLYFGCGVALDALRPERLGVSLVGIESWEATLVPAVWPPLRLGRHGEFPRVGVVSLRMDPEVSGENGLAGIDTALRLAAAALLGTDADLALLANGDTPVVARVAGRAVLNARWGWSPERRAMFPPTLPVEVVDC